MDLSDGGRSSTRLELQIVDLVVAGSNPVAHPISTREKFSPSELESTKREIRNTGFGQGVSNDGRGGIRTHERLAPLPVFETGPFNHSGTLPWPPIVFGGYPNGQVASMVAAHLRTAMVWSRLTPGNHSGNCSDPLGRFLQGPVRHLNATGNNGKRTADRAELADELVVLQRLHMTITEQKVASSDVTQMD